MLENFNQDYLITVPKNFETLNLLNEQKWTVYCISNPVISFEIPLFKIVNIDCKKILEAIQYLYKAGLKVTLEEISSYFAKNNINIPLLTLKVFADSFKDFDNIVYIKNQILDSFISYTFIPKITKQVYETLNAGNGLDKTKLKTLTNELLTALFDSENKSLLKDTHELKSDYIQILNKRKLGERKYSLGFRTLDKHLAYPAQASTLTTIVALKGMLKSIFVKNIELSNINNQIPVLSLNLEMPLESTLDRIISTTADIPVTTLQSSVLPEEVQKIVYQTLDKFALNKYYLYSDESEMSLTDLDLYIQKAKLKFRERGVLKENEDYVFVTIDLLEMIKEFSEAKSSYEIRNAINRLHNIYKKHKVAVLATLQANESKIREQRFRRPEDLDFYKVGIEDIANSAAYAERSRLVLSLNRPVKLKQMFFPEQMEEWNLEPDIINVHAIKANDAPLFFEQFVFSNNFKIFPYKKEIS